MKKILTIIGVGALYVGVSSCTQPSERDLIVMDREQTSSTGIKTDLNMKVISSEEVGYITGQDSLDYFYNIYSKNYLEESVALDTIINRTKRALVRTDSVIVEWSQKLADAEKANDRYAVAIYKPAVEGFEETRNKHELVINNLTRYYDRTEEKICKKVKYTYQINNPLLNGVEQEITKTYLFTIDESEIIGEI